MRRGPVICIVVIIIAVYLVTVYVKQMDAKSPLATIFQVESREQTDFRQKPEKDTEKPKSKCRSAEPGHIPSPKEMAKMSHGSIQNVYHSYASNAEVICQKMLRMGVVGDGGWEVCDDPGYRPTHNNCLVYSFGINNDFSFDDMVGLYYGCEVHSFDPSMKLNTSRRNEKVMFHHLGVSGINGHIHDTWPVNTLSNIRKDLGHSQRRIDVLKMDIEGSEWPTLEAALKDGAFENVTQLLLEVHGLLNTSKESLLVQLNYLRTIRQLGYRIFYAHKNHACSQKYDRLSKSPLKTSCYEIHMMKIPSCVS